LKNIEYATMAKQEREYWWHIGRLRIIQTYIDKVLGTSTDVQILNIGCGTGGTIDLLEQYGTVDNVDISNEAIKFMKKNGYKRLYKVDDIDLPFKDKSYDLICAFDVLEHIAKESSALKEWYRVLKPGGSLIITVPAYQWLWSNHDVSLEHKRRYTKKRLGLATTKAGFLVNKSSYAIVFSLPLIIAFRFINKLSHQDASEETSYVKVPKQINSLFTKLLYVEARLHQFMPFPAGTSVIAVLHRAD
jgi:SAM-dependent methyltransferase